MVASVGGNGNAAAEAARRAAEAARKAAEEAARRAAEAARKAALAAQKTAEQASHKASEQAAKAAAAKQNAETFKAVAKKAVELAKTADKSDPAALKQAQSVAQQATKEAAAHQKAAEAAQKSAETARSEATKAGEAARASTVKANEAARAEGKPEPFPANAGHDKTGFDSQPAPRGDKLGGSEGLSKEQVQSHLHALQDYARLAQKPEMKQALDKLGIKDGVGLEDFGAQLAHAADGGSSQKAVDSKLAEARKDATPHALAEVLQSAARAAGDPAKALATPQFANAVAQGKTPREVVLEQKGAALPAEEKRSLKQLGIKPEEYAGASKKAQAHLDAASQALTDKKPAQALAELRGAAASGAGALAGKGLERLAEHLHGVSKELLSNPDLAQKALHDKATGEALHQVLGGDPHARLQGLKTLAQDDSLRDATLKAASKDPDVQKTLSAVGLEGKDLESLGKGADSVLSAAAQLEAKEPAKALTSLDHALQANPELAKGGSGQKVLDKISEQMGSPAKELLADPKTRAEVLAGGSKTLGAVGKLAEGKTQLEGLKELAQNDKLRGVVAQVADKAQGVKQALSKLGLEPKDLAQAKEMLPSVLDAAQKAEHGHFGGALDSLRDAVKKGGPLSEKMLSGLAQHLPEGLGVARSVLQDPAVIKQMVNNDAAFDSAKKLFDKHTMLEGIGGLLKNDGLRNAVLDAAGKDPGVKAQLEKVGLTAADLKQAGAAAPHLFEAGRALLGDKPDLKKAMSELGQAGAAAPELLQKVGQKLYEKLPQGVKDTLSKMGLDSKDLVSAKDLMPSLVEAAQQVGHGHFGAALDSLHDALKKGGPLSEKLVKGLASQLPDGVAKNVLKDPGVVKQLINNDAAFDSAKKLFSPYTALEGLGGLIKNDGLRDAVLDAAGKDPSIKTLLDKVGMTTEDLKQAGAAAPHLFEAGRALLNGHPDWKKAASELSQAGTAAPHLLNKVGEKLYEKLPQGVKDTLSKMGLDSKDLSGAVKAMPSVLEAVQKVGHGDFGGALDSVRDALKQGGPLSEKLLGGLARQLPEGLGVAKSILKDPEVIKQLVNNDAAFDSAKKLFNKSTVLDGVGGLLSNDGLRNAVLDAAAKDPGFKGLMDKVGFTAEDLKQAGAAAPHLFEAGRALFEGKGGDFQKALSELGQAAGAAPELLNKLGQKVYDKLPAGLQKDLSKLGLTKETLKEAGAALPHLVNAGKDLAGGKPEDALKEVGQALEGAPEVVSTALNKLGEHLKPGIVKDLLTNKDLIKTLVSNKDLHGSIQQILSGTPEGLKDGLTSLSANAPVMKTVADALWKNDGLRGQLQKLGFESSQDLADAGKSFADVMQFKDLVSKQPLDIRKALETGLDIIHDLPDGLKQKISDKITQSMHLPKGLSEMVIGAADAFNDPEVRKNLGDAVSAFQNHDVGGFIKALGATGETIANKDKDLAVGFLDMMGHLPGSVGRFFSDHELNKGLVDSGAVSKVFDATQKLASGDIGGALGDMMHAAGDVAGYGKHFRLEVPFPPHEPHVTLPFGKEGLTLMGHLAKQFVEALPDSVRDKIKSKITEAVAKAGGSAIPGGGIISAIGDGKDLIEELSKDHKDWVEVGLKTAEVALDVAGTVGAGPLTGPLRAVVGTVDVLHGAQNLISNLDDFKNQFAFGA